MNDVTEETLIIEKLASSVNPVRVTASTSVSAWAIRNWCHVMGITDPLFTQPQIAIERGYGAAVAPPAMLQLWTVLELQQHEHGVNRSLRRVFTEAGYSAIVATNYDLKSFRLAHVGDLITTHVSLDSISSRKDTPLGTGYFATEFHEWFDQDGNNLGELKIRCFYFRPLQGAPTADRVTRSPDTDMPGELAINVDTTLIVAGALVGNDFERVHHDRDLAREQGLPDIIMNIATSAALAFRYSAVCEPHGLLTRLSLRLGVPCCPGDVLHLSGQRTEHPVTTERAYTLVGKNNLGEHLKGSMVIQVTP
ncbi:N-terminal half of MaoC dehydratase [Pseudomonas sp. NFACC15-1]|uniref:FAS1-like dehydratase domain-containing protein n=1 Tax=unclassified Pseudomonas TaxID=196821 RepID=UPI0008881123|nr:MULTISPECIES: MaoC family dehydratase N-terminal domain-containing protein [unclassified Pseudomonas]SDA50547.1 N-terminal half of MaoC dehydratase [Pseudomonas sp. NFACC15-1]SDW84805.1 N-terminal half of MaoC dehydratase [Pseudomonas sp. NFACC14]